MMEREITFTSGTLHLAGTLTVPDSKEPSPAVLLIPGSGQVDRNENHKKLSINAFREITDCLVGHGIATLRYDKRGVGTSCGNYWETGFFDNIMDASSALMYLKACDGIRTDEIFLLGHSEGAIIATKLAGDGADVAGIILLGGTAQSGEDTLKWQAQQVAEGMGSLNKWLIKLLRINVLKAQQKQLGKIKRSTKDWYRVQFIVKINAKWMREFMDYNPAEDMPRIRVPVLAITGSKDIQVDPEDLTRMSQSIPSDFEYHELPNVTHILRTEEGKPSISTYKKQARQPMDSRILHLVSAWLQKRVDMSAHR